MRRRRHHARLSFSRPTRGKRSPCTRVLRARLRAHARVFARTRASSRLRAREREFSRVRPISRSCAFFRVRAFFRVHALVHALSRLRASSRQCGTPCDDAASNHAASERVRIVASLRSRARRARKELMRSPERHYICGSNGLLKTHRDRNEANAQKTSAAV